jgi:hypothetical protein
MPSVAAAAPVVTVDTVSDVLIGSADTGTDITWHSDEVGTYKVVADVPGQPPSDCTTGNTIESGVYTAPVQVTTTVSASSLLETLDPIRVCVTDAVGNLGVATVYVVKDVTAPTVTIDNVSDALIGAADTGTTVTWHASEPGAYSVRVGGDSCATGTTVESGYYVLPPRQRTTTISAGDLGEGANTIRICADDMFANGGAATTNVDKDTTAPTVAIDDISDTLIGPGDTGTDVTWHADADGAYSVRVGGDSCTTGQQVANGSYTGAPLQQVTTVNSADLQDGDNTVRVCVNDAAGNAGSDTRTVVKDTTAPAVAIDAVSDSLVGPAAPATDISWHAEESGPYSVRAGGSNCTTGQELESGTYATPPDQQVATINADQLVEGQNTIRICVADAAGNEGSDTRTVAKDTTAPAVAIANVSDTLITPGDSSTNVTWHADEDGAYSVRVGGDSCNNGNQVEDGSYAGAPGQQVTTVNTGDLQEGANTIRACVTDPMGNNGSQSTSVTKDSVVTLTYSAQADSRVEEANPNTNFGTSTQLAVEGGSALDRESYLRFQVTGVLGVVQHATLRLWVTNGTANGPAAYKTDWTSGETAITWNNRPARTSGPIDDKGAIPVNTFVDYDVTPLVTGNGLNGFDLATTSSDSLIVSSKEASTVANRPQLILTVLVQGTDTEKPTAPTGLTGASYWPTEVDLNWEEATDNIDVTGYRIDRDDVPLTTVGDVTHFVDTTAQPNTTHEYEVRALDAAQNVSDASNDVSVTTPPQTTDPVIMAAGDQACDPTASSFNSGLGTSTSCRQKYTSDLLVNHNLAGVLALGDIQYECGGYNAFLGSYDPTWGRVKSVTYPVPGNHEYHTTGGMDCDATGQALGYFTYFGAAAGDPDKGYYSFDVGTWHLIGLNSNCAQVSCAASSAQANWLRDDLAAHANTCTLAFWHHPRFTSGVNAPGSSSVKPLYQALYDNHADVVLVGHDHDYERFALKDPDGALDPAGIRQIVVGTGGKSFHPFGDPQPGSEARNNDTFGVLKMILGAAGYEWRFIPEAGKTYTDSGSAACNA